MAVEGSKVVAKGSERTIAHAEDLAYRESVKYTPDALTEYLLDKVGQRITAVGVGLKDARQLRQWAEGGKIRPTHESRLRLLYRVARAVEMVYDQETARAFLRSTSPYLGDAAPVEAVAAENAEGALEAVRYFLEP